MTLNLMTSTLPSADDFQWKSATSGASNLSEFWSALSFESNPLSVCHDGYTPFSDARLLVIAIILYLAIISSISCFSPPRFARASWFVFCAAAHNAALCVASFVMLVGMSQAIVEEISRGGVASTVCNPRGIMMPSSLSYWLYLFYISKFWELFDTVILVLRGNSLTLLHVWHHASVMVEMYGWLEFNMVLGVYGMVFNTLVHTLMYSYYAAALLKIPVPWKRALTSLQIVQFCVSFASLVPYTYYYIESPSGCTGGPALALSGICNGSFLVLFIRFFKKAYGKKSLKKS